MLKSVFIWNVMESSSNEGQESYISNQDISASVNEVQ